MANDHRRVVLVTGVTGQDGFFLAQRLLGEGSIVHGVARRPLEGSALAATAAEHGRYIGHQLDLLDGPAVARLLSEIEPDEIYNLAGQSSVSASFAQPMEAWRSNAEAVALLLDAVRTRVPSARLYQSSSGEMFGWPPGGRHVHTEASPFLPRSPYAAAKASAHLLCSAYRQAYGLRIACGILFNHESHRRPSSFLTRKVLDHVSQMRLAGVDSGAEPLPVGNLAAERDWGFAPDYVAGMVRILRQISVRAEISGSAPDPDISANYRDYILATGRLHAVWQLVDRAFALAGMELVWEMSSLDALEWRARFRANGRVAVVVDPALIRPSDPVAIAADPSRAQRELGWATPAGLDGFLQEMLDA